jgi:hypothetical protein
MATELIMILRGVEIEILWNSINREGAGDKCDVTDLKEGVDRNHSSVVGFLKDSVLNVLSQSRENEE